MPHFHLKLLSGRYQLEHCGLDSPPVLRGTEESTDGSEVEGSGRAWMGCLSTVCGACPPNGFVLQVLFQPSLPCASGPTYSYLSALTCQGERAWSIEGGQSKAGRDAALAPGLSPANVPRLPLTSAAVSLSPDSHSSEQSHPASLFAPIFSEIPGARGPFA